MTDEDRWSRTALPLDLDFDAQSFVTSFSNLDNLDSIDDELAKARMMSASPRAELLAAHAAKLAQEDGGRGKSPPIPQKKWRLRLEPFPAKCVWMLPRLWGLCLAQISEALIPPRSKKRDQAAKRPSTAPKSSELGESKEQQHRLDLRKEPELKTFKELQLQEQERAMRSKRQDVKLERSRETTRRKQGQGGPLMCRILPEKRAISPRGSTKRNSSGKQPWRKSRGHAWNRTKK